MQSVKRQNTAPELVVRRILHAMGYRFRLHRKDLPGTPDIVLPRHRKIVLVHGCFWHGHAGCPRARLPASNVQTWHRKLEGNQRRDQGNIVALEGLGWDVLVIWECELSDLSGVGNRLRRFLEKGTTSDNR
ncbi:very short patch repair endonuclease [Paraburkholderia sediminicola]|nr:very short patch repair endonuclease [Paraburkholderia sediminicola]